MDARSNKSESRRHWWSGFFSRNQSKDIERPMTPLSHHDSVLLQEDLFAELPPNALRREFFDHEHQRPAKALIGELLDAFYKMTPFLGPLTVSLKKDLILCRDTFLQLRQEVESHEDRPDYEVDIDLLEEKSRLSAEYRADQELYEQSLLQHSNEVDRLSAKIHDIDQQITQINAEQVIDNLRDLEIYQRIHHEINEQISHAELAVESASCFSRFFCCTPKAVRQAYAQINVLERKRQALSNNTLDELRDKMVERLKIERAATRAQQDLLSDQMPVLQHENRDKLVDLEALIHADEAEYYHEIPEKVMLQLLRLYEGVRDAVRVIPDVEHLTVLESSGVQLTEDEVVRLKGIRDVLDPLKSLLKDRLPNFYCALPGRFYFTYYVEQFRQLTPDEQDEFIRSDKNENLVARVFTTLEPEQPASTFAERRALLVSNG